MRLIIVSGLSGSGKSVALNMLEDLDYYCVDNIPAGLLPGFIAYTVRTSELAYSGSLSTSGICATARFRIARPITCATLGALGNSFR